MTAIMCLSGFCCFLSAAEKPNIVVILVDDMGWSDIGCYGGEIETPHLDRLAQNGVRFTHFYNTARCCPTRASLLTGLYQHQAGIGHMTSNDGIPSYQGYLNDRCLTIAEALRPAGYATLSAGKWHVGSEPGQWPLDRGFDRFWGTPAGGGVYFKETLQVRTNVFFVSGNERVEPPDDLYVTDTFTTHALAFIEEAVTQTRKPFFLYLALSDNGCSAEGGPGGFSRGKPGAPIGTGLSYASVGLEWANASDTPFRKFKMDTYEGGIATPLIAHWPGGMAELSQERPPTGHVVHAPGHVIDIMPTLLEIAGAGYLEEVSGRSLLALEGRSLKPLLTGRDRAAAKLAAVDRPLFWEHQGNKAVRLGNWKAVGSRGGPWELYNLAEDRTELRDTAKAHPEKTCELAGLWRNWADRCGVWEWDDLQDHRRKSAESKRR